MNNKADNSEGTANDYIDLVDTTIYINSELHTNYLHGRALVIVPLNYVFGVQTPIMFN